MYEPLSNWLIYKQLILVIPFSLNASRTSFSITVLAGTKTSPVSVFMTSLDVTFPNKNSSSSDISLTFDFSNSFICLAVILLPAFT